MDKASAMAALSRAAIPFEVGGVTLTLRKLKFAEAQAVREYRKQNPDKVAESVAKLFALSVTWPDGSRMTEADAFELDADFADRIAQHLAELNGWGDAAGNS